MNRVWANALLSILSTMAALAIAQEPATTASEEPISPPEVSQDGGASTEFLQQQRQQLQVRYQKQMEDNKTFLGTLQGKTVKEKCEALLGHIAAQYNENVAFHKDQFEKRVQFVMEKLAKRNQPAEKQAAILESMNRRRERINRMYEEMYQKFVKGLTDLAAKPDATDTQVTEVVHAYREAMRIGVDAGRGDGKPAGNPPPAQTPPPAAPAPAASK